MDVEYLPQTADVMDVVEHIITIQNALAVIGTLMITTYLFPINMLDDEIQIKKHEFDFVIVGAGSAGSVIADRLSEVELFDVLVIDAGGDLPFESLTPGLFMYLPETIYDWNISSYKENSPTCPKSARMKLTSGKVLGGSSSINYHFYVQGARADYNKWAETTNYKTWNWQQVFPYIIKNENLQNKIIPSYYMNYHGTSGFLKLTRERRREALKYLQGFKELHEIVPDINGEQPLGYSLPLYSIGDGVRQTTAYTNLAKNKNRSNLHVLKHTIVTKIIFDVNNKAKGVNAIINKKILMSFKARKAVIISAGALHSPQLLMLSGIGPKEHLESQNIEVIKNLPVGENYHDHVITFVSITLGHSNETMLHMNVSNPPFPSFVGYVALNKNQSYPDYQAINYVIHSDIKGSTRLCAFNFAQEPYVCQNLYEATKGKITLFTILVLLHPKSRGNIMLTSKSPIDSPHICTGTFADESDLETLASSVIDFLLVLNTKYFQDLNAKVVDLKVHGCGRVDVQSMNYWKCYVNSIKATMFDYSGTCSMGSVVDGNLNVLNTYNLRVADASIMPVPMSGNIYAPVIMIAEKLSDMIKQEYNTSVKF